MVAHDKTKVLALFAFALLAFSAAAFAAPVASAGSDQTVNVGQNVTVSGAASTCSGCSITSYSWNWGDGNTSSGVSATHSYNSSASYTVTLTVVANDSSVSSDTLTVTVQSSDATAPTITHTNVTDWTQNQSITITATVTDNVGVSTVTLYYKNASAGSYSSSSMSASGSTYTGSVPNTSTSESNALYYITASDTASPANTASHGSSSAPVNVTMSATDTIAPITSIVSVSGDTSSPYWVTTSNATSNNVYVVVSGESGMSCRMGSSNSNYSGMTVSYVDCTISGSTANCTSTLGEANYTRYVACKDSSSNEQNTSQTLNVTFGVDSVVPTAVSALNATEGTSRITLSWTAPTDATSGVALQKIFRSADSTTNYSTVQAAFNASGTAYNDTSLTAGVTYRYYIVGQDAAGNTQSNYTLAGPIYYGPPLITAISLTLSGSTLTLAATTNENASCRYASVNMSYSLMESTFTTTGATSHSAAGVLGSSGTITYYVRCADTAGNNMTTANSTSYTFSSGTTTPASSSNTGGGSVGGGAASGSSSSEAETFTAGSGSAPTTVESKRTVDYSSATGISTFKIKVENTGSTPTGPIVLKEEIPSRVASSPEDIVFSLQPTRFENGSIIAVWELEGGIGPGESLTITYSVKKAVSTLAGFKTTVSSLVAAPQPQPSAGQPGQPPAGQPAQPPEKKPAAASPSLPAGQPSGWQPPGAAPSAGDALGGIVAIGAVAVVIAAIAIIGYALFGRKKRGL